MAILLLTLAATFSASAGAAETGPQFDPAGTAFVQKFCLDCHSGDEPQADLDLAVFKDSAALIPQRKAWLSVLRAIESGIMPPEDATRPTPDEIDAFTSLVRGVFEHHDRTSPPDPGRVTMRRLNRTEYNNTIRDLVGVDFNPAEDFPSDDIGHGFDNIGDVLTLPPVLLERYLAAADSIMRRAILPDPPPPPNRHISARYTEPAGRDVSEARFRPISNADSDQPIQTGPLFTRYQVPAGDYVFRSKVYAETTGDQPVRIAVLACSDELKDRAATDEQVEPLFGLALNGLRPFTIIGTIEITARSADQAQNIEIAVSNISGLNRTAIALFRREPDAAPATVHVEYLGLQGPLDTRPESHRQIMACDPDAAQAEQIREILTRFATRAYRRPATAAEVARLSELAGTVLADGGSLEEAVQFALQAVLVSPKFLFRVELDSSPGSPDVRPLDEYQLASRLSYFLWSSMPDDELLSLASQGQLREQLDQQVDRMLKDARAASLVDNFGLQWLQLQRLQTFSPDPELFPSFDDPLRHSMLEETRLFLQEIVRDDRSILDMLDADFTYMNELLARHYGIADTNGNPAGQPPKAERGETIRGRDFVRVTLQDRTRGGLLTQASVLTVTSNPTRTSPVKRGKWVLEQLLGTPPPPPPPNVPELEAGGEKLTGTLRQQMEQHRENPACAACHARMDPLGFAFENFDAIGRFRTRDGEHDIDASGELPGGRKFSGAAEVKQVLTSKSSLFARCVTEKLLTYALGRGLEYYDGRAVNDIVQKLEAGDHRLSVLVKAICSSDPFTTRRGLSAP